MNKMMFLKWINFILFISMATQALTGIVLFFDLFVLRARLFEFISEVHRYNGLVLVLVVLTHLYLNWGWVKSQFLSGLRRK